jgi:hypothetical protein
MVEKKKEIIIKKAEYTALPKLKLTLDQKREVKNILDKQLRGNFPNLVDMKIVYDIADILEDIGLDNAEIMRRVANFGGNIDTFTSPTILRKIKGRELIEERFKPKRKSVEKSFEGISKRIIDLIKKTKETPTGEGYVAILTEDGKPVSLIDFGKFVKFETKDALQTHIDSMEWNPTPRIIRFLVVDTLHETDKILKILKEAIDES